MSFNQPLRIDLRPSRIIVAVILLVHVTAAALLLAADIALHLRLALLVLSVSSLARGLGMHAVEPARGGKTLVRDGSGRWVLHTSRDEPLPVDLVYRLVLPWLVVAVLQRANGRRLTIMLTTDNIEAPAFRRLRVFLRYGNYPAAAPYHGKKMD